MSATLRVSDFVENKSLFPKPPPLLNVEARQHPVAMHFSKWTASDYVEEAFKKVSRINRRLPPGGEIFIAASVVVDANKYSRHSGVLDWSK
jgi:ATP-dependent RNA helicase DHX37/DHR1